MKTAHRKTGRRQRTGLTVRFPSEYNSWKAMRARCRFPSNPGYPYFGALGIRVCLRWDAFAQFLEDMGPKPSPRHGISRKDAKLNFTPENCYWATPSEQQMNSLKAVFLEYQGERLCIAEWSRRLGISMTTITTRMKRFGWTVEQALGIAPLMGQQPVAAARRASAPKRPRTGPSGRNTSSGVLGVSYHKRMKTWQALLRGMGEPIYCGNFATKKEAVTAVEAKAKEVERDAAVRQGQTLI